MFDRQSIIDETVEQFVVAFRTLSTFRLWFEAKQKAISANLFLETNL